MSVNTVCREKISGGGHNPATWVRVEILLVKCFSTITLTLKYGALLSIQKCSFLFAIITAVSFFEDANFGIEMPSNPTESTLWYSEEFVAFGIALDKDPGGRGL